jgi:GAF domain-containing protein
VKVVDGELIILFLMAALAAVAFMTLRLRRLTLRIGDLERSLARADAERSASADDIAGLYRASQATSVAVEPGGIMDTLADDARKIVGCRSASVAVFVEKDILASVTRGITSEFKRNLRWRVRKGGMTDWVLSTGKHLVANDAAGDPRARDSSAVKVGGLRSILAVPLVSDNEVFGVLYLGDTTGGRFSDHDLMLASILANHAAASLRQARLGAALEKKLEELECAHKELVGADRLKSEFIAAVTSEMRLPLDAIRSYSQTVLHRLDDASFTLKKKFLGAVVDEAVKLLSTVNGVIDLSRMEFGEGDLRREEVRIDQIAREVCGILEPSFIERGVDVSIEASAGLPPLYLDKDMICLFFRNLLEAATGFAKRSTQVRLALGEEDEFVRIEASFAPSPSAVGMESALRAIWGDQPVPPETGPVGLGLQVCRNVVLRHGGRMWSETHEPGSWNFIVLFGRQARKVVPSDLTFEIVSSRPELKRMLALVAEIMAEVMDAGRCMVFLEEPATGSLVLEAKVGDKAGDRDAAGRKITVEKSRGATGRVYESGLPIVLNSREEPADPSSGPRLPFEKEPCAAVPIRMDGRVVGVVTVSERRECDRPFDEGELGLLAALADRISVALERATSYESARDQFVAAMTAMKSILAARRLPSAKPAGAGLVAGVARGMGLAEEEASLLCYVSRIYDVGMVKVGEEILRKRGGLGASEYENVKRHPAAGVDIVGPIEFLDEVRRVILHHHERYDGGGYPGGLKGEEIPVGARILAVVDAYNSMVSERPYRGAMSREEALEELRRSSGSQFDPKVVEKFIEVVGKTETVTEAERRVC